MIIRDNSIKYDTDFIDAIKNKEDRTSIERDILNEFFRHAYYLYMRIRDCVNTKKCKKISVEQVRERLLDGELLEFTERKTNLNNKQIHYIIEFNEKYNQAIKIK